MNPGNPREMTILEFAQTIEALTESRGGLVCRPLPRGDPKQRKPDISKARKLLEGLRETVEYFRRDIFR